MKKHTSRRDFLRSAVTAAPATLLGSALAVPTSSAHEDAATSNDKYHPAFFTTDEWRLLEAATDRLIPADELGPGALAAAVPEFIDRQMEAAYGHGRLWYMQGPFHPDAPDLFGHQSQMTPRDIYRIGFKALDRSCRELYGAAFADLPVATRDQTLTGLQDGSLQLEGLAGKTLFAQLLENTREGFFSDPQYGGNRHLVGWKFAGFPGARADFMDWVDFPNQPYPLGPVSIDGKRG
ncbi:gluconate 2-dehydrogenase subunit 3 family protein [Frateuria aurantia]